MRILLLAQFYPPDVGGEERHVQGLAQALLARGHEVSVVTQALDGVASVGDEAGVRVHRVRSSMMRLAVHAARTRPHAPPFPDPEMTAAIRRVVATDRPDVAHAHNWIVFSAATALGRSGTPLLLTLHDYSQLCPTQRMMLHGDSLCSGPGLRKCLSCAGQHYGRVKGTMTTIGLRASAPRRDRRLAYVLAVSNAVAEHNRLAEGTVPWSVVPNFVPDSALIDPARPPARDPELPDGDYITYVGELHPDKGAPELLAAYGRLPADRPALVCIGAETSPIDPAQVPAGVVRMGRWSHARVMSAQAHGLFGVVPSTWPDPCPTTALEAMAAGRPVIATRTGGLVDQVEDGASGLLVPPADVTALSRALGTLVGDAALRDRFARGARDQVRRFTAGVVAARVEQLYETASGSSAVSGGRQSATR